MAAWSPVTESELRQIVTEQLAACSDREREAYAAVKTPFQRVPILRGETIESVFSIAQSGDDILIYDDIEHGFEWCLPESDGVIRSCGSDQAHIQARLQELLD